MTLPSTLTKLCVRPCCCIFPTFPDFDVLCGGFDPILHHWNPLRGIWRW